MVSTLAGIIIEIKEIQPLKALAPIDFSCDPLSKDIVFNVS